VTRLRGLGDRLVAVVRHNFEAEPFGISTSVWWSKDARRWANVIPRVDERPLVFDVTRFRGRWIATTTGPTAVASWNGTDAMESVAGIDGSAFDRGRPVIHGGRLVIPLEGPQIDGGNPTAVMLSTADGRSWIETAIAPDAPAEVLGMVSDGSTLVALGNGPRDDGRNGVAAWWTTDGLVWTRASLPAGLLDAPRRTDAVAALSGGFIALSQADIGGPPDVIWSADGRTWHLMPAGPDSQVALPRAFGNGDSALFYLQPYVEFRWYLWEAQLG
jgi:hypothetical protein